MCPSSYTTQGSQKRARHARKFSYRLLWTAVLLLGSKSEPSGKKSSHCSHPVHQPNLLLTFIWFFTWDSRSIYLLYTCPTQPQVRICLVQSATGLGQIAIWSISVVREVGADSSPLQRNADTRAHRPVSKLPGLVLYCASQLIGFTVCLPGCWYGLILIHLSLHILFFRFTLTTQVQVRLG